MSARVVEHVAVVRLQLRGDLGADVARQFRQTGAVPEGTGRGRVQVEPALVAPVQLLSGYVCVCVCVCVCLCVSVSK